METIESYSELLFEEKQRFTQWWIWLILIGVNLMILFGIYTQMIRGIPFGDNPAPDGVLIVVSIFLLLLTASFLVTKLEMQIRQDGIYVRFFPFHRSFRHHPWIDIRKAYIRKYKPIPEYGGWGISGFGKNRALNVSGNK